LGASNRDFAWSRDFLLQSAATTDFLLASRAESHRRGETATTPRLHRTSSGLRAPDPRFPAGLLEARSQNADWRRRTEGTRHQSTSASLRSQRRKFSPWIQARGAGNPPNLLNNQALGRLPETPLRHPLRGSPSCCPSCHPRRPGRRPPHRSDHCGPSRPTGCSPGCLPDCFPRCSPRCCIRCSAGRSDHCGLGCCPRCSPRSCDHCSPDCG
jgi:hypothetical protein